MTKNEGTDLSSHMIWIKAANIMFEEVPDLKMSDLNLVPSTKEITTTNTTTTTIQDAHVRMHSNSLDNWGQLKEKMCTQTVGSQISMVNISSHNQQVLPGFYLKG